ncbi:MAG: ketoacyl-ACP synthase III [Armatimonas sp.]
MLGVKLAGLGKALPERIVTNTELEEQLGLRAGWIEKATGVRERRRAPIGSSSVTNGAIAARQAIERARITPNEIDLIIGASSGPEQLIPCTAALLQRELDLPEGNSACFDVNATCLSFLVALHVAAPLVASGAYRAALLVSSELSGLSLCYDEPESATLLGDGAAAAVLLPTPAGESSALRHVRLMTFAASGAELTRFQGGGSRRHPNDPATTPAMNRFEMQGPGVFRLASRHFPPFLASFLEEAQTPPDAIDLIVPHQASGHGVYGMAARTKMPEEKLFVNLPERGNCIAASLPLALCEAWETERLQRGQTVLLAGTGAGLTLGAGLLTF